VGGKRAPLLEAYDYAGVYAFANAAEAEHYATLHMQAMEAHSHTYQGLSTLRTLRPGTRFTLTQSPLPQEGDADPALTVTHVTSIGINNLPKPAQESLAELFGPIPELLEECLQPAC
jgi:uncharacterized protein involved in type VI secretion and phage assembly